MFQTRSIRKIWRVWRDRCNMENLICWWIKVVLRENDVSFCHDTKEETQILLAKKYKEEIDGWRDTRQGSEGAFYMVRVNFGGNKQWQERMRDFLRNYTHVETSLLLLQKYEEEKDGGETGICRVVKMIFTWCALFWCSREDDTWSCNEYSGRDV